MSELLNSFEKTMNSREIAELTGKSHANVLADIDKLNKTYEELSLVKVDEGYYLHPNTGEQQHRCFYLNRMQTLDLLTGYKIALRIKVNRRWEELENNQAVALTQPKHTPKQLLRLQQTALITLIKSYLMRGDMTQVARDKGFSIETMQNVMSGHSFNPEIVKAMYDKAKERKATLGGSLQEMISALE